ncbi:hypothetical protein C6A85_000000111245 [Mycobacterium sp. ITM-2017-0098]|nr:hypothetical protein C6A85_000000111245 [Mycobacterium sp. ITM-2017-0098]
MLGSDERISAATALALFTGDRPGVPQRIGPGARGDLCILTAPPADVLAELDAGAVAATVIAGEVVYAKG